MVSPFRERLWELFQETAKGMDGADVVVALKQAGEEIWAAGIDDTYSNMSQQDQEPSRSATLSISRGLLSSASSSKRLSKARSR